MASNLSTPYMPKLDRVNVPAAQRVRFIRCEAHTRVWEQEFSCLHLGSSRHSLLPHASATRLWGASLTLFPGLENQLRLTCRREHKDKFGVKPTS